MESAVEPRFQIDHAYLESVEAEIALALQRATELEAGLEDLRFDARDAWFDALDRLNANLSGWGNRLAQLTEQTAVAEGELNEQENAMRTWIQMIQITSAKLSQAAVAA